MMLNSHLHARRTSCVVPSAIKRKWRRLFYTGLGAALAIMAISGANPPAESSLSSGGAGPARGNPMDEPLRLLGEAHRSYQNLKDYSCILVKRERLRGQLQAEHTIAMKVQTQPFNVYLQWIGPKELKGQAACYATGRNKGMMQVRPAGVKGILGFVSVDPNDPRTREHSAHPITEAGIGNLIKRFAHSWELEHRLNATQVRLAEYEFNKRRCIRVEAIHPNNVNGQLTTYRTVLYFDKENHLPIRLECYDWPRPGGARGGELTEVYSYVNLKTNVGIPDNVFNH